MTMTLAHPAAEDLGRFVEGTLDDAGRTAVVAHIADCDECRILVVDTAELGEPATGSHWYRWVAIAAAAVLVTGLGMFTRQEYRHQAAGERIDVLRDAGQFVTDAFRTTIRERGGLSELGRLLDQIHFSSPFTDPLAKVTESYGELKARPIEARLSGFPYLPHNVMRGSSDETEPTMLIMQSDAASVAELRGNDPKTLHARGVGLLLLEGHASESLAPLTAAAASEPQNARYQNDLTAALITVGQHDPEKLQKAMVSSSQAVNLNPRSTEALFNRGEVLELLGRTKEAIAAYEHYLSIDSTSPGGADEVRKHLDLLRQEP
jgi:tetratricopeptide (TPR) repeat protein